MQWHAPGADGDCTTDDHCDIWAYDCEYDNEDCNDEPDMAGSNDEGCGGSPPPSPPPPPPPPSSSPPPPPPPSSPPPYSSGATDTSPNFGSQALYNHEGYGTYADDFRGTRASITKPQYVFTRPAGDGIAIMRVVLQESLEDESGLIQTGYGLGDMGDPDAQTTCGSATGLTDFTEYRTARRGLRLPLVG